MALTVTAGSIRQEGPVFFTPVSVAFDSSYPNDGSSGGESLDYETYIPGGSDGVLLGAIVQGEDGYFFDYNSTVKKIRAFVESTGAQVADTTDLSALTAVEVLFISA